MNIHRFKWPAIIAASLHGALFLVSKEPSAPLSPPAKVTAIVLPPMPDSDRAAPEPDQSDEPVASPAATSPTSLPTLPDRVPESGNRESFKVPVTPTAPPLGPVATLKDYRGLPFGPGDGIGPAGRPAVPGVERLDRIPRAMVQAAPAYPEALRRDGLGGEVVVEFVVDPEGRVVKAEAVKWSRPEFAAPAVRAVLRWRFQPGTIDGRPVSFRMAVPIVFSPER